MNVCPHARRMDLPCPDPECFAGVGAHSLTVPVVRHMGTMFVRPTIAHERYTLVIDVQMGGPFHGARCYSWMRDTFGESATK